MAVGSTIAGGATRGLAVLSHAERQAAANALAKLKTLAGKTRGLGASALIHGQGSDTFLGGARSTPTHALANIGNDTVVSGSVTSLEGRTGTDPIVGHTPQPFNLSADTISLQGVTADAVKAGRPEETHTGVHTVTLPDKTTVTISGLSQHDVDKLKH